MEDEKFIACMKGHALVNPLVAVKQLCFCCPELFDPVPELVFSAPGSSNTENLDSDRQLLNLHQRVGQLVSLQPPSVANALVKGD